MGTSTATAAVLQFLSIFRQVHNNVSRVEVSVDEIVFEYLRPFRRYAY